MGWQEVGGGLERGREWVGKRWGVGWEPGQGKGKGKGKGRAGQALSTSRLHLYFSFGFGVFGEGFGI